MHWNDFFIGVVAGWILSLAITLVFLFLKLKSYDNNDIDE